MIDWTNRCPARLARGAIAAAAAASALQVGAADADPAPWSAMPASLLPMRLPVGSAPGWNVRGLASGFQASDATPVGALSGGWGRYTPRSGRNAALQSIRIELGAESRGWEISGVVHSDIVISGSRSTFDLIHDFKQRLTPSSGSTFALSADDSGALWTGLRGARTWTMRPASDQVLRLTTAMTLLSVLRVQQVSVAGLVSYSALNGIGIKAQGVRQDSHQQFGGYGSKDPNGLGYTMDVGLLWQPSDDMFLNFSTTDLFSRLRVVGVSTQRITVSSSTTSLDANGYINYQPLLSGQYESTTVDARLARKSSASFGGRLPLTEMMVGGRWECTNGINLPSIWAQFPLGIGLKMQLDTDLRFDSIGLGLQARNGSILVRTRTLPWGRSNATGWMAEFVLPI